MRKFISFLAAVAVIIAAMTPAGQLNAVAEARQVLFINEIMAANSSTIRDGDLDDPESGSNGGVYSDWIEIYNVSSRQIDLKGYTISDNGAAWTFPQVEVPAGGYLLVWASDKNKVASDGQLHTNFKLSSSGETVTLKDPYGTIVDSVKYPAISDNSSYGRKDDASPEFVVFSKSTPAEFNQKGQIEVKEPVFSQDAGFYTEAFNLQLTTSEPGAEIYYTTDGSDPVAGASGTYKYTSEINIKSRTGEPNVLSMINLTGNASDTWKGPSKEVFKCTTIKAAAYRADGTKSRIVTKTYFVDPNMKTRYSLPVVSIVSDRANFFDNTKGILVNGNFLESGKEWERPIHIEYFEKDGTLGFSQYCGIRVSGDITRWLPQKTLRLYADGGYDNTDKFKYDIFPDLTKRVSGERLKSFSRLLLRNSGNDWKSTMMRDAMVHSLISNTKVDTQAYRPAVVFLDGEYWGIHNFRERYDNLYFASHYDLDKDKVVLLEFSEFAQGTVENINVGEGTDEDALAYKNDITDYLKSHSIAEQSTYEYIKTKMDIDNFIDYQIVNIFCANRDWPNKNVSVWKYKTADGQYHPEAPYGQDGRWRWILRDTDIGFGLETASVTHNTLMAATMAPGGFGGNLDWSVFLFRTLLRNSDFKLQFISRFADQLNTAFDSTRVIQRIDEMKSVIESSISEHIDRWEAITDWNGNIQTLKTFATDRSKYVRQHIMSQLGGTSITGTASIKLNTDTTKGYIKINSIDIKASTPGVTTPEAWTGTYFKGVPVTLKAIPEAGYKFDHWEGITDVSQTSDTIFFTPASDTSVTAVFTKDEPVGFKVSGFVKPDLDSTSPSVKSGFKVEITGENISAVTNSEGYFEMNGVPKSTIGYTVKISKDNYLYREIKNVVVSSDKVIAAQESPIAMWAGDMLINGAQDDAINIKDIMEIAGAFNTALGDGKYNVNDDLNADNAVNIVDIIIAAMHFNTTPLSY